MLISNSVTSINFYAQSSLVSVYMTLSDSFDNGKSYASNPTVNADEVKEVNGEKRYYYKLVGNKADVSITDAEIYGYELSDVLLGSSSVSTTINSTEDTSGNYKKSFSFNFSLGSDGYTNKITLKWTPMQYRVVYSAYDQEYIANNSLVSYIGKSSDLIKYDDSAKLAKYTALFDGNLKSGYDLLGWEIKGDSGVYDAGSSIPVSFQAVIVHLSSSISSFLRVSPSTNARH